jgi:hypothetical protein
MLRTLSLFGNGNFSAQYTGKKNLIKKFRRFCVGLSNGRIPNISCASNSPNLYALWDGAYCCLLSGRLHNFKWPTGANKPKWNGKGNVVGCGILMSPANKVSIFFTLNGILMGLLFSLEIEEFPFPT